MRKVALRPGQFVYGRTKASEQLRIKPSTLNDIITWLKDDQIIDIKSNNKFSVITVVNWDLYQIEEYETDSKTDNKATTKQQQSDTNKNVKNVKNIKDLSLEFEKFRQRYDGETLKKIDQYFDILRTTRRSGKISDSIIEQVYGEMNKHPPVIVEYACTVIIGRPELQSKKENYFYGIMRNTEADEAERKLAKIGQASEEGRYKGIIL